MPKLQCCNNCGTMRTSKTRKNNECRLHPPKHLTVGCKAESKQVDVPNVKMDGGETIPLVQQETVYLYGSAFPIVGTGDDEWCAEWSVQEEDNG